MIANNTQRKPPRLELGEAVSVRKRENYCTVSVPTMPASLWPGTLQ
jgi:hypothetical protein